jgi:hypothetical protein
MTETLLLVYLSVFLALLVVQERRFAAERREWTAERQRLTTALTGAPIVPPPSGNLLAGIERVWGTDEDEWAVEQRRRRGAGWEEEA